MTESIKNIQDKFNNPPESMFLTLHQSEDYENMDKCELQVIAKQLQIKKRNKMKNSD